MKPTKLIGILLFLILSVMANAYEYEITNEKTQLYSDRFYYDGKYHSDSGTIYAYAYMTSDGKVRVKVKTKSGKKFNYDTAYYISKNSRDIRYKVASSPNMKGRSYYYVTFSPNKAEYYVVLGTKTSSGKTVKFYIDTPIKVKKKATPKPTVSSVSFPTLTKDTKSKIKFYGSNFVSGMAFTIADANCESVRKSSSSYAYTYCTPRASGSKSWIIKDRSGGNALKRGYVTVKDKVTIDNKPTMSIQFFPSTVKKTFNSRVSYSDDKGLVKISCRIYKYGNTAGNYLKYDYKFISGTSYNKNWSIDVSSLADGKYEVMFFVTDGKNPVQEMKRSFVKEKDKPTVSKVNIPTLTKDKESKITFNGSNFISGMAFTIYNADCRNNNIVTTSNSSYAYIYCTPRASGSKSWVIKDRSGGNALKRGYVTVNSNVPTVRSIDLNPRSGQEGLSRRFTANLSGSLSSGYKAYINFDNSHGGWLGQNSPGGHVEMYCSGSSCYKDRQIHTVGNRKFRVGIFKGNSLVGNYSYSKSFIVTAKPEIQYAPTVSISNASGSAIQGKSYQIKLAFYDKNSNLKNAFVNWGDGSSLSTIELNGKESTKYISHTYNRAGNFTWRVEVNDHTGKQGSTQKSVTVKSNEDNTNFSEIINYLNRDNLIGKMGLSSYNVGNQPLSRSDAVVLIDGMRNLGKSSIKKDMQEYYNPFADVPQDAEYLPSLMRLAYYKSNFNNTVVTKYNTLFNPMHHATREEFVKMAMNGFDVPKHSADLSKFNDRNNMSDWARKYFETAVYNGIIVGNNGKLLAYDKITIKEALIVLRRIKTKFGSNYSFNSSRYETPESLDLTSLYHKTIGFEYEPRYYKPNATPIDIGSISARKKDNYYILTVNSNIDSSNGASDYYWWSTDKGYFREAPNSSNYKTVYFYPMSTLPKSSYHITVNGGDNLGYVDSARKEISVSSFNYPESTKVASGISANLSSIRTDNQLIANKLFTVDLTNTSVKKTNIELSIDQVTVSMRANNRRYELFHGTPQDKKARFVMGDYADLYGKDVKLSIEVYSQDKKYSIPSKTIKYKPQFTVRGRVYNAVGGTKVTTVIIGNKSVKLDENGEFYYTLDSTNKISGLRVRTKENSQQNHFDPISIDLTYESPSKYVVLTGEDARPSLNLKVSPITVPSHESVKFTLTSDKNIPSNAKIDLEDSSCSNPRGLGSRKVEITCTTPITSSTKYILMSVSSNGLYGDGLSRTIVVDKSLNGADAIERAKNQLSIPSTTTEDINLPTELLGVSISWSSSNSSVISSTGIVTQQKSKQTITLTAYLSKDGKSDTKSFEVTIPTKDKELDTDGDGISDVDEEKYGFDPLDPSDATQDYDGDGVSNFDEIKAGTNPLDPNSYPKTDGSKRYMKVAWFLNGQSKKVIPDEIKGKIVGLFTWWGDHSIKVDLDSDGSFDYDFNEDYYGGKDVSDQTLNLDFTNGFSLQDYELWIDYWEDSTHRQINCWATNSDGTCQYAPNGAGALFYVEDNKLECKDNVWLYNNELVSGEEIYCIKYIDKKVEDKPEVISDISNALLANLYFATMGRTMSSAGLDYWTNTGNYDGKNGKPSGTNIRTMKGLSANFATQIEYRRLYPEGTTNSVFINQIFQNLFQRDAASSYWEDEITAGRTTRAEAVMSIISGAKGDDAKILENRASVAIDLAENYNLSTENAKNRTVIDALKSVTSDTASKDKVKENILFFINF